MKLNLSALKKNFSDNKTNGTPVSTQLESTSVETSESILPLEQVSEGNKTLGETPLSNNSSSEEIKTTTLDEVKQNTDTGKDTGLITEQGEVIKTDVSTQGEDSPLGDEEKKVALLGLKQITDNKESEIGKEELAGPANTSGDTSLSIEKVVSDGAEVIIDNKDLDIPIVKQSISIPHISISSLQKSFDENEAIGAVKKSEKKDEIIAKVKDPELFGNYKPSFDGRAKKFMQRLRTMKLKPKTRLGLVIGLIIVTLGFITYLFIFHSEKHSFTNYKHVIVSFFVRKKEVPIVEESGPEIPSNIEVVIPDIGGEITPLPINESPEIPLTTGVENSGTLENSEIVKSSGTTDSILPQDTTKREELRKEKIKDYFLK